MGIVCQLTHPTLTGEWLETYWTQEYGGNSHQYRFVFRDIGSAVAKLVTEYGKFESGLNPEDLDYKGSEFYSVPQSSDASKQAGESLCVTST